MAHFEDNLPVIFRSNQELVHDVSALLLLFVFEDLGDDHHGTSASCKANIVETVLANRPEVHLFAAVLVHALLAKKLAAAIDDFESPEPHHYFLLLVLDPIVQLLGDDLDHDVKLAQLEPLESHLSFHASLAGYSKLLFF